MRYFVTYNANTNLIPPQMFETTWTGMLDFMRHIPIIRLRAVDTSQTPNVEECIIVHYDSMLVGATATLLVTRDA